MSAAPPPRQSSRKLSAVSLRKLARVHTEVAVQVLADVATKGTSEASRISAAMALLDRGYGKTGTKLAVEAELRTPTLYHRIELIDGTEDKANREDPATDRQD